MRPPAPDFVIAGGPRCGTTAVYKTLQRHPSVFLPGIKEPHYFALEYNRRRGVETAALYESLFAGAQDFQLRGDASAMYLSSQEAIPAIRQLRPDAKFIALARNPIDMFVSWHNQCLATFDEDVKDPERAWRLQDQRLKGCMIPPRCHEPISLQYRTVCSLGAQIKRLFDEIPESQRLVLLFDDIQEDPRAAYQRIVNFLGVADDGRTAVSRENSFARPRSELVARLARLVKIYRPLKGLRVRAKTFLNAHGIHLVESFFQRNMVPAAKPELSAPFVEELQSVFQDDIVLLQSVLKRDLSAWERPLAKYGAGGRTRSSQAS